MSEEKAVFLKAIKKTADYLARRSHSEKELRLKLAKHFSAEVIEQAIQRAQQQKWLEDPVELSKKTVEKLHSKNKSWKYIKNFCYEKDLPLPPYDRERELVKARKLFLGKSFSMTNLSEKEKVKIKKFLAYRGFEQDVVDELLS